MRRPASRAPDVLAAASLTAVLLASTACSPERCGNLRRAWLGLPGDAGG